MNELSAHELIALLKWTVEQRVHSLWHPGGLDVTRRIIEIATLLHEKVEADLASKA